MTSLSSLIYKTEAPTDSFYNTKMFQDFREYTRVSELSATILKVKNIAAAKDPEFIARIDTTFHPMCEINKLTKEATILKR